MSTPHPSHQDDTPRAAPLQAPTAGGWRGRLYQVVFESDTRAGQLFDRWLIGLILLSVLVVAVDSMAHLSARLHRPLVVAEWLFTLVFTLEYLARLACVRQPLRYALSFFGIVDLLAVLPTYLALLFPEIHALIDVRVLRLLRMFRVFKLTSYLAEYQTLANAMLASRRKIVVFLSMVMMVVVIMGTVMYVVEGPPHGFSSIPTSVYWAITTMTTVGFGDLTPKTDLGRLIASFMMLLGWGTLAVPTGIVTVEMSAQRLRQPVVNRTCPECLTEGHVPEARHCLHCGARLPPLSGMP